MSSKKLFIITILYYYILLTSKLPLKRSGESYNLLIQRNQLRLYCLAIQQRWVKFHYCSKQGEKNQWSPFPRRWPGHVFQVCCQYDSLWHKLCHCAFHLRVPGLHRSTFSASFISLIRIELKIHSVKSKVEALRWSMVLKGTKAKMRMQVIADPLCQSLILVDLHKCCYRNTSGLLDLSFVPDRRGV